MLFPRIILAALAAATAQARANTSIRLYHDRHCKDEYRDIEVWVDTCATWITPGWSSYRVMNYEVFTWINTFSRNACAGPVTSCADNTQFDCVPCYTDGGGSNAINSWATKLC